MKSNIVKCIFLFQLCAFVSSSLLSAQTTVTIGRGVDSSEYFPFNAYYKYSWSNVIYKASDIGKDGLITEMAFYINNKRSANYTMNNQKIYARHTTSNVYKTATYPTSKGFELVFDGTITYAGNESGWKQIKLTSPFLYNGTDNLEFLFENKDGTNTINGVLYYRCTKGLSDLRTRRDYADQSFPFSFSTCNSSRAFPNIQLTILPCSITLGTIVLSSKTVLSITGQDQTSSLQWQSSPDNIAFTNIKGATLPQYETGLVKEKKYYRVQQNKNGCIKYTTSILVSD